MPETLDQTNVPLPHSLDAERAALGTVLLDPRAMLTLQDAVKPDDFYSPAHRAIFLRMMALAEENQTIDLTVLAEALRRNNELEAVGGPAYLASLEEFVFTTENLPAHAKSIVDMARLRRLIAAADEIRRDAFQSPRPVSEILDQSEKLIFDLTQESESREFVHVAEVAHEMMDEIETRFHNRQEVTGLRTGYTMLDEMLTGFHPSELIILAARPSVGKTALALNIAQHVILHESVPTGFFSLEMSNVQVVQRILAGMARVPMQRIRRGMFSRADLEKLDQEARRISNAPLYVDDTPGLSILELRAKARRLKQRVRDLGLIVVDYLQLMRGSGRAESRQQEVSEIARSLKALARELELPVLALSQLSRGIEQRKGKDKTPKLSDLRESGALEQDADVVLFIHREQMARVLESDEQQGQTSVSNNVEPADIIIGKQRNGPRGTVRLLFFGEYTRFENVDREAL